MHTPNAEGPVHLTSDKKFFADLWIRQAELVWKAMALMPLLEGGILAAWYVLIKDADPVLAFLIAVLGVVVMGIALLVFRRTLGYVKHFRKHIEDILVESGAPKWERHVFLLLPLLCVCVNFGLAFLAAIAFFHPVPRWWLSIPG